MAASALLSSLCLAASFAVPEMPEAEWDDTEVVTNAALPAARADSRVFAFSLELDATASNNVEVAFGRDADHDGVLSRAEADMLVGWDCGEWKVVDCATGDGVHEQGAEGRASFEWRLEFSAAHPPRFLYSPEWDTVRVVCRGMDSPSPSISGSIDNIPPAIRIR